MASKTVTIPSKIVSSLPIGFILTVIIFILIHFFGKWLYNTSPDYSNTSMGFATAIYNGIDNKCLIFDENHYVAFSERTGNRFEISEMNDLNGFKWSNSLKNTFDTHLLAILLSTIVLTLIIYLLRTIKFQIE